MSITNEDLRNAAILSGAAYEATSIDLKAKLTLQGWRLLSAAELGLPGILFEGSADYLYNVINAEGFAAVKDGVLAVSFRGTTPGDLITDLIEGNTGFVGAHFELFDLPIGSFVDAVKSYAAKSTNGISKILVTGHSLGGAMAEKFMAEVAPAAAVGVTFGSPGVFALGSHPELAGRLLNLQHSGDPVRDATQFDTELGADVVIDRVDSKDRTLGELAKDAVLTDNRHEHAMVLYSGSANMISQSKFFNEFVNDMGAFSVLIGQIVGSTNSGTFGRDLMLGLAGRDTFYGLSDDDLIEGGRGNDELHGGKGADWIDGGADRDVLIGDGGDDCLFGGEGLLDAARYFLPDYTNYDITRGSDANGQYFQIAPKSGQTLDEGADRVYGVESFEFANHTYTAAVLERLVTGSPPTGDYGDLPGGGSFDRLGDDIPGNTRSDAYVIAGSSVNPGVPITSAIETPGDKDFIQVFLTQGATYRVLVSGVPANGFGALTDTFFRIRDGRDLSALEPAALAPTILNSHDQAGPGNDAQVDFLAPYTGRYFVSIGAGGPTFASLTGGYQLSVTLLSSPPGQPQNHAPVAVGDQFVALYGDTVGGNLLGNDTDVDSNVLGAVPNSFTTALGGNVSILSSGAFRYVAPTGGPNQIDSFTYTVRDGAGGSATGTVTINLRQPALVFPAFTENSDVVTLPDHIGPFYARDGHDVITASSTQANSVSGGEGNDTFYAQGNGSNFFGGPGDDWFVVAPGGRGTDLFVAGELGYEFNDVDTLDFSRLATGILLNVNTDAADMENIVGTPLLDVITGDADANQLKGLGGNDTLSGMGGDDSIYGGGGGDTLRGGAGRDFLDGGAGNDDIQGGDDNDALSGGDDDDVLSGEGGDDYFFAGAGNDRLIGSIGTDTADFAAASVGITGGTTAMSVAGWGTTELEQIEIVIASRFDDNFDASPSVTSTVSVVRLGAGNDWLRARDLAEVFGDDGDDVIVAQAGGRISGGLGNDQLFASLGSFELFGDAGNDGLFASGGADELEGGDGDDVLDAGSGDDSLLGGAGADRLSGGDDDDVLDGGADTDALDGGIGNDTYVLFDGSDTITDTGGLDTITSAISRSLVGFAAIENLTLLGATAINGVGNALVNTITGNSGANILDGGLGLDTLRGGLGNDTYVLSNGTDRVVDSGGIDTISSTITRSLASYSGIENLTLLGTSSINGTGTAAANVLIGNAGSNRLTGGGGKDIMTGGAARDIFDFNATNEIGKSSTRDRITDFTHGSDDIDLSTIDANGSAAGNAFKFLATKGAVFTGVKGQLHWFQYNPIGSASDKTFVEGDVNGDKVADFQIELTGLKTLTSSDFLL